jgi:mono/diheme cytochrome c family protein
MRSAMLTHTTSLLALSFLLAAAPGASAQGGPEQGTATLFEVGGRLFAAHCAVCHGDSGAGRVPFFPALRGNERLQDLERIVETIRRGRGAMPAFGHLAVEEVTSLAHYIRNAWDNTFGPANASVVGAVLERLPPSGNGISVWEGIFTGAQAERGRAVYSGACGRCHGRRLDGAPDNPDMRATPPLARAKFLRNWQGRTLASLYEYMRATMPESSPGSLTDEEYVDVIAYMLSVSGAPEGETELKPDSRELVRFVIEEGPGRNGGRP